jgi:predicted nucleic acid-binding protein
MIVVDNTFLSLLFYPEAKPPNDPKTGKPIDRLRERIDDLVARWRTDRDRILIPAPVLSEFLYLAENDGPAYLAEIDSDPLFRVRGFDQKAAIELAALNLRIKHKLSKSKQKQGKKQETKAKINFDKQIVAIAIANGTRHIYSDDKGVGKFAAEVDINVVRTSDLPPPKAKQLGLSDEKGAIRSEKEERTESDEEETE